MRRAKIAAVAAMAGATAIASCASAATTNASATTGNEMTHLLVWSVNSDGPDFRALATGAVGDYGSGVTVHPDGTVDPEHTSQLRLSLAHGSFRLDIVAIHEDLMAEHSHWSWNTANCSGSIKFTDTIPVVAGTGTGVYRGITGSFRVNVTIDEVTVLAPEGTTPPCPPEASRSVTEQAGSSPSSSCSTPPAPSPTDPIPKATCDDHLF